MKYLHIKTPQYNSNFQRQKKSSLGIKQIIIKYWYIASLILGVALGSFLFNYFVLPFSINRNIIIGYQQSSIPFKQNELLSTPYK
ncbi:MAG TPA: hypothetical protein VHA74_01925, partial [Candidatus Dojkabacteria bacterium]|nr:hypothetical protein [Candidatus Dojkabacteria bacterium]